MTSSCLVQVVPTKRVRGRVAPASQGAAASAMGRAPSAASASTAAVTAEADDLLPRTDISGSITGRLTDSFSRCPLL